MSANRKNSMDGKPRAKMPGWKFAFCIGLALIFDLLKFIFSLFIFFGPVIAGAVAGAYVADNPLAASIVSGATRAVGYIGSAGLSEVAISASGGELDPGKHAPEIAAAVVAAATGLTLPEVYEALGIVLAMVVGLVGWIFFFLFFVLSRVNLFKEAAFLKMMYGFVVSEVPLVDMIPTFTPAIWSIVRGVRKSDARELKSWEERMNAAWERQRQTARMREQAYQASEEAAASEEKETIPDAALQPA